MIERQDILNKNLLRLYYKNIEINSIGSHVIGFDLVINGETNSSSISDAFDSIVSTYLCLQFQFSIDKKGLEKEKLDKTNYLWSEFDSQIEDQKSLQKKILDEAPQDINPEKGINVAGRLYRINDKKHILSITASHLVADAQSMEILLKDFLKEFKRLHNSGEQLKESLPFSNASSLSQIPVCEFAQSIGDGPFGKLKKVSREKDLSLFNLLMAGLTNLEGIQTDTIGVLFSHRTKETQNEVGCFVQAVPVYLNRCSSFYKTALSIKKQIAKIHRALSNNEDLPDPPRFKVMFSMVVNPDMDMPAPDGVEITYLRRLHTTPECDLHIYAYQYREKLEIVFNYHPDKVDREQIKHMHQQYIDILLRISSEIMTSDLTDAQPVSLLPAPRFHHVGAAVWEMDIGLMRLKNLPGVLVADHSVMDNDIGVSLASCHTDYGGQLELIAPVRKGAPCVGFLERYGEGPYHCTWQISSIQPLLNIFDQRNIKYTLIEKSGKSKLFPGARVHFLIVRGIGLVEFIPEEEPESMDKKSVSMMAEKRDAPLTIEILSNDCDNAVKFLHSVGYEPKNPVKGTWRDRNNEIEFLIQNIPNEKESRIDRIIAPQYSKSDKTSTDAPKTLSDNWRRRVCI